MFCQHLLRSHPVDDTTRICMFILKFEPLSLLQMLVAASDTNLDNSQDMDTNELC